MRCGGAGGRGVLGGLGSLWLVCKFSAGDVGAGRACELAGWVQVGWRVALNAVPDMHARHVCNVRCTRRACMPSTNPWAHCFWWGIARDCAVAGGRATARPPCALVCACALLRCGCLGRAARNCAVHAALLLPNICQLLGLTPPQHNMCERTGVIVHCLISDHFELVETDPQD